jgi:hypothetical protein
MPVQTSIKQSPAQESMPLQNIVHVDPDLDGKESNHHVEATVLSNDPKVALQSEIEELLRLSQEDYEIVHRRLVRKVSRQGISS